MGAPLHGHLVSGHLDTTATVLSVQGQAGQKQGPDPETAAPCTRVHILLPASDRDLLIPKGSLTVQGVSLTINGLSENPEEFCGSPAKLASLPVDPDSFAHHGVQVSLSLIPTTLAKTTLGSLVVGQRVNIEYDLLGKYFRRALQCSAYSGANL